jgi:ATP-dependent Zn protease
MALALSRSAGALDLGRVIEIIGQDASEEQHRELRCAGYRRARELILLHKAKVVRLATRLLDRSEVKSREFVDLMHEP